MNAKRTKSRGRNASRSGLHGENVFLSLAEAAGFRQGESDFTPNCIISQPRTVKPWGTQTIGKQDYELRSSVRVLVQVKNWNVSGTAVLEKLCYAAESLIANPGYDEYWIAMIGIQWRYIPDHDLWAAWIKSHCYMRGVLALEGESEVAAELRRIAE